jgi:PAS domain S-box-containing protein
MIFEFRDKPELENIINSLDLTINIGYIVINELLPSAQPQISDPNQPENVTRFFTNNYKRIIEILNMVSEPIFIKDKDFCWVFLNQAFCNFFAIDHHDILGKTSRYLFSKKQSDVFEGEDNYVLETGRESVFEEEITDHDGNIRIIVTKKKRYVDIDNRPYIIGSFYEITDHRKYENSIKQENTVLENRIKERTIILTQTISKLQEEINQRRLIDIALSESEEKFRSVIEQSLEGIALANVEGKIIEWNKGMQGITGIPKEKAIGMYQWDIEFQLMRHELRKPEIYKKLKMLGLETLLKQKIDAANRYIEGQIMATDGTIRFVHLTAFEIKTNKDFYVGRIARDITEQKTIADSLQRSENQYKTIFQHANDAILILNPDTAEIIAANDKASEIYGFAIDEIVGRNLKQISKNISYDQIQLENLKKNKILKNFETVHFSSTGNEIFMLVNGSVIEYDGKKAIMNIYNDITELKQSEKARAATFQISQLIHTATKLEDLYEPIHNIVGELMNAANFYIALYDEEQDVLSFPYHVDEKDEKPEPRKPKRGLTEYVLRHGKPLLANQELLEDLARSNEIEYIGTSSMDWIGVPLITQKKVIGVIVVQSYSKGIRYSLQEKDLLVFISEQIAILIYKKQAEEEIIKAKEIAEESDKLKTAFIANMSHELRTPMTGIIGFTSILAQKITDADMKTMLDYILVSSNRLMSTLNSILELSQLEAGKKPLEIQKADLNNFIDSSIFPHMEAATKKNILIEKDLQENISASFNDNFLIQILHNLISNAIKFTEKGSINIKTGIRLYQEETFGFVSVSDTGIGIAEDHFTLIFENFRQVSEGMNRTYEGTGLGLSLCKKMAEMMGGRILVESTIGIGSTFTLLLPYSGDTPIHKLSHHLADQMKSHVKADRIKPKVLVVDDNKINGELIFAYLKNNYEVEMTTNGSLAIELVKVSHYDAILMDINLGEGINGIETTVEIRNLNIQTPVIALTAYSTEKEMQENIAGYFTNYILKPVDRNSLISILERSMDKEPVNKQ